jgi:hypothetical protein
VTRVNFDKTNKPVRQLRQMITTGFDKAKLTESTGQVLRSRGNCETT